jgi:O-methyltransferase
MYSEDIISTQANIGFMHEDKFIEAYNESLLADKGRLIPENYSIRWRIHTLLWASKYALSLDGDFIDFGGGFGIFASAIYKYTDFEKENRKYFLLDSFEGLKQETSSGIELDRIGYFKKFGSWHEEVVENFKGYKNMEIIKGFIPETLNQIKSKKVCFVSVDLNALVPEKNALDYVWEKLVKGGIIVFDDYGFPGHESQKLYHDEFAKNKGLLIYTSPTGQGILIK